MYPTPIFLLYDQHLSAPNLTTTQRNKLQPILHFTHALPMYKHIYFRCSVPKMTYLHILIHMKILYLYPAIHKFHIPSHTLSHVKPVYKKSILFCARRYMYSHTQAYDNFPPKGIMQKKSTKTHSH